MSHLFSPLPSNMTYPVGAELASRTLFRAGDGKMLETFTVSFFGHREVTCFLEAERRLEQKIRDLLSQHEFVEFLVGRNGEFDQMVASTVIRLKRSLGGA